MVEACLYKKTEDQNVHCYLCAHQCRISPGKFGFCGVRENKDGVLCTHAFGKLIAANVDPIEKKPLYHFLPGTNSYSVATIGCNFRCGFCQNWQISQQKATGEGYVSGRIANPADIVNDAKRNNCASISYTYTEPTIYFEYALEIAKIAKGEGLKNVFVSNGYMTTEALELIHPYLDACNIDLKFFNDRSYIKNCKAHLEPVLNSITKISNLGIWIEVTTLMIPGENDSKDEITGIAEFLKSVNAAIPWHISRFFPQYDFQDHQPTSENKIFEAEEIGKTCGLKYVYPGNITKKSKTVCTKCNNVIIQRQGFIVEKNSIRNERCSNCNNVIEGVFS